MRRKKSQWPNFILIFILALFAISVGSQDELDSEESVTDLAMTDSPINCDDVTVNVLEKPTLKLMSNQHLRVLVAPVSLFRLLAINFDI